MNDWRILLIDRTIHLDNPESFEADSIARQDAYEATLEDPKVYTYPWKLRLPLHRPGKTFELMEYECNEGAGDASSTGLRKSLERNP